MADTVSPEVRSRMMSGIRAKDTKPELIIRRGLHAMGLRFRLHAKELPGKPDLILPKYRAVIFVHGCFWHAHECALFKWPKSREEFWREKISRNRNNDRVNSAKLAALGWRRLTIWECTIKRNDIAQHKKILDRCREWLQSDSDYLEIGTR
jgi:DNA mismatch endonuclease (patch repair protein)